MSRSFTQRYLLWLVVPPAIVTIPLAFLFLEQVLTLTAATAADVALLLILMYALAALAYLQFVAPQTRRLENADAADASMEMSECLQRTITTAVLAFGVGVLLFAIICTLLVLRSGAGFGYFIVAALMAAFPGVAWAYAAGKRQLALLARGRYAGRELSIGKKIAIVFIGSFIISSAALVELISSDTLMQLERLAIESSAERFQRVYETANLSAQIDAKVLDDLRLYIPRDYALHLIPARGAPADTGQPLTSDEVNAIRRIGTGDSTAFASPHVVKFAKLKDGSILAMSIPWEAYRNIPAQITYYTFIIALLTTLIFSLAASFLHSPFSSVGQPQAAGKRDFPRDGGRSLIENSANQCDGVRGPENPD